MDKELTIFKSLFRGRADIYAIHWEKGIKSGYMPAYIFDPYHFKAHRMKGGTFQNYANKQYQELTDDQLMKHLKGEQLIGLYPLLKDNTSYFLAVDFDKGNWMKECRIFMDICVSKGIPAYLERSRSGNGAHVWIFFEDNYSIEGFHLESTRAFAVKVNEEIRNGFSCEVYLESISMVKNQEIIPNIISEWYICSVPQILFSNQTYRYDAHPQYKIRRGIDPPVENEQEHWRTGYSGSWDFVIVKYNDYNIIIQSIEKNYLPENVDGIAIEYRSNNSTFPKVQLVLNKKRVKKNNRACIHIELPLRGFLNCPRCGKKLQGSGSTGGSGLKHYYYHCQNGCKERVKARKVDNAFSDYLSTFKFKKTVQEIYEQILQDVFKNKNSYESVDKQSIKEELEKNKKRLDNARKMMLDGEMDRAEYMEIKNLIGPKINEMINQQVDKSQLEVEFRGYLKNGLNAIQNLGYLFDHADVMGKQTIARSILKENAIFSNGRTRTAKLNHLIELITYADAQHKGGKKRKDSKNCSLSGKVAGTGPDGYRDEPMSASSADMSTTDLKINN